MNSIKLKWVILYLTLVFIIMIISGTFMLTRVNMQETKDAEDKLVEFALKINEQVIQAYSPDKFQEAFNNNVETLKGGTDRIQGSILNSRGQTIASNVTEDIKLLQYNDTAIISALSGERKFSRGRDVDITGQFIQLINYAEPVLDDDGNIKYVIFTRFNAEPILKNLIELAITLALTVIIALILTGILGFLYATTLTGPIIVLTKKAKELARGKLKEEIPVNSTDEIGQLTQSFNYMSKELSETMATFESEKNKMEILLHNMTDGVLAYDRTGSLIHANFLCRELLKIDEVDKVPFADMMKRLGTDISDLKSISDEGLKNTIIYTSERFVSVSFTPYYNKYGMADGIVIVLQDITQHKKLDDMRKEFVANVSHEIRTPITTIKSYAETLLDGALENESLAKDFLTVIESEADRMTLLVKDLLDLSQLDNKQLKLELTEFDLIKLIHQCIRQNSVLAEKKNQTIKFDDKNAEYMIKADPARINQVITNIISNAVKYSGNGTTIFINAEEADGFYVVKIKDSGIGIPKEDLPNIFERFYRVDKARSRAMGGTGLGLAIAKEIIEAHNGKIFAESKFGVGTTMTLKLRKIGD